MSNTYRAAVPSQKFPSRARGDKPTTETQQQLEALRARDRAFRNRRQVLRCLVGFFPVTGNTD